MKKTIELAIFLMLSLSFAACGGGNSGGTVTPSANADTAVPSLEGSGLQSTIPDDTNPPAAPQSTQPSDGSFFPDIDDALVPDVLKKTVGKSTSAGETEYLSQRKGEPSQKGLTITFRDASIDDYNELLEHYKSEAAEVTNEEVNSENALRQAEMTYDWGVIRMIYSETYNRISVDAIFNHSSP